MEIINVNHDYAVPAYTTLADDGIKARPRFAPNWRYAWSYAVRGPSWRVRLIDQSDGPVTHMVRLDPEDMGQLRDLAIKDEWDALELYAEVR